jgi:hypothetical protein
LKKKTIEPKKKKGQKNFYYMIKNRKINLLLDVKIPKELKISYKKIKLKSKKI